MLRLNRPERVDVHSPNLTVVLCTELQHLRQLRLSELTLQARRRKELESQGHGKLRDTSVRELQVLLMVQFLDF